MGDTWKRPLSKHLEGFAARAREEATIGPRVIWLRLTRASRVKRSETCVLKPRKPALDDMQVLAESGGNLADSLTLRAQISRHVREFLPSIKKGPRTIDSVQRC